MLAPETNTWAHEEVPLTVREAQASILSAGDGYGIAVNLYEALRILFRPLPFHSNYPPFCTYLTPWNDL